MYNITSENQYRNIYLLQMQKSMRIIRSERSCTAEKIFGCITKRFTYFISEISVSLFKHIDLHVWFAGWSPPPPIHDLNICALQFDFEG